MAPSRALSVGAAGVAVWLAVALAAPPVQPAAAQAGSVAADRDGWWNRAKGGNLPLTSPSIPFPVPPNGLAVAASNGEPEKAAAVGIRLDVDSRAFQRLILNLKESASNGSSVGVQVAAIKACAIEADWTPVKDGNWPPPTAVTDSGCINGTRSAEGVWSFDLSAIAQRWLAGDLAQNGVLLVENVNPPASFQVTWGDRTTPDLSFGLDVVVEEEGGASAPAVEEVTPDNATASEEPVAGGGSDFRSTTGSFEFSGGDAFATAVPQEPAVSPSPAVATPVPRSPPLPAEPISVGENLPAGTILLGPLALFLAGLAAYSLGPAGNPSALTVRREGGVSRALARRRTP